MPQGSHDGNFPLEILNRIAPPPPSLCFIRTLGPLSFQLNLLHNLQREMYRTEIESATLAYMSKAVCILDSQSCSADDLNLAKHQCCSCYSLKAYSTTTMLHGTARLQRHPGKLQSSQVSTPTRVNHEAAGSYVQGAVL